MFNAKTDRIKELAEKYPKRIKELSAIFDKPTGIYIDYANVRPWSTKLGWHVDPKRLKQFLDSFTNICSAKIYNGTLTGDKDSEDLSKDLEKLGYELITKPVKIMRKSIDVSSIPSDSTIILKDFVRKSLLQQLKVETIEYLNSRLREINEQGIRYVEDWKCNFDVEMSLDMLIAHRKKKIENFIIWSGDSDFESPILKLLKDGKKVYLFATARKVSRELNDLKQNGLRIFEINKIRNFICWKREIK